MRQSTNSQEKGTKMDVFQYMLSTPFGLFSLFTIAMVIVIAVFLFFWVKKQAERDENR